MKYIYNYIYMSNTLNLQTYSSENVCSILFLGFHGDNIYIVNNLVEK